MNILPIIAKTLHISEDQVKDDLSYQSIPEWNSLNHVALMMALENALGKFINQKLLMELTSVAAIKQYVQDQMSETVATDVVCAINSKEKRENFPTGSNIEQQSSSHNKRPVYRGLNNIAFDNTTITHIDGEMGILRYRGYSIQELVDFSRYEEVAYLLIYKGLPTKEQLENFNKQLRSFGSLPEPVANLVCSMAEVDPITVLRTATSMLAAFDEDRLDNTYEGTRRIGIRLIAQLPKIIAMHHRYRNKQSVVPPNPILSHAANILLMLQGKEPSTEHERILDRTLILHADHSSNASAFTARVVTGTQADIYGAITAAIAAFAGPLHGGAVRHAMKMLREIGDPVLASSYIQARRERQEPIMGFGHRVYRAEDPRAKHLRQNVQFLSTDLQEPKWLAILDAVVETMRPYNRHGVHVNVDFYACVIYSLLGLSDDLSVPLFVLGRIAGWVAQVLEQWENNILIRPVMHYVGKESRPYLPIM